MTDEELVLLAQKGDEKAMNELLNKYKAYVNKSARSYFLIGGDIEDIAQEGMIGLYKAVRSYASGKNAAFKTYANICIKHQIQTAVKSASSAKNKILSTALPIWEQGEMDEENDSQLEIILPSSSPSPDDKVIANENVKELNNTLKKLLSPLEIKVLSLYLKGYKYDEISRIGKISKKSIDNALTRIKNKLSYLKDNRRKK